MIRLYGFKGSNYYSVVKLALLEKGLPFEEVHVPLGELGRLDPAPGYRDKSPIGKVPALETGRGFLSETSVILDYLDDLGSGPSFYPKDPYEKAKVREIMKYLELYAELPARGLYAELLYDRPVTKERRQEIGLLLEQGFEAIARIARFDPYIAGEEITYADFFACFCLASATWVTRQVYGWDTFNTIPGLRESIERVGQRETTRRVMADREASK